MATEGIPSPSKCVPSVVSVPKRCKPSMIKLSLTEKIARLPPEPHAAKQRARLLSLLEEAKKPQPEAHKPEVEVETTDPTTVAAEKQHNKKSHKKK